MRRAEQSTAQRQFVSAMAVGEKAVVANAVEAVGQDVKQESANELAGASFIVLCFIRPFSR